MKSSPQARRMPSMIVRAERDALGLQMFPRREDRGEGVFVRLHFLGTSENAVRIQIVVALIAYLLLRLAQATQKTIASPLAFARLVRANLMHRRRIDRLLDIEQPSAFNPNQLAIKWN